MENICNTKREVHGDEEPKIGRRAKTSRPGKRAKKNNMLSQDDDMDDKFVRLPMFDEI